MVADREIPAKQCTITWQLDTLALSGARQRREREEQQHGQRQ